MMMMRAIGDCRDDDESILDCECNDDDESLRGL